MIVQIPYTPRRHQRLLHDVSARFGVVVCHRRFGKTVYGVNEMIKAWSCNRRKSSRYAYIAPFYKQAKAVAWDYLKDYTAPIPGTRNFEQELRVDMPDGGRLQLFGSDNPDALRGIYLDGVVLDEVAQMPASLWGSVIRPTLADRGGWARFLGTPRGRDSFYELYHRALSRMESGNPDWWAGLFKLSDTKILHADEEAEAKSTMSPEEYAQEMECSFDAAVKGAYYARALSELVDSGRLCRVPVLSGYPVHTAWDLGMADSTAIWFVQALPSGEIRVVDYEEATGEGLEYYARLLDAKGYWYGTHIAPHDIAVRELGTGVTRLKTAQKLGINFVMAPSLSVAEGIEAVRQIIPRCWIDKDKCRRGSMSGFDALMLYRASSNERSGQILGRPLHDWTSHAADAFRYLAVGLHLIPKGDGQAITQDTADRLYYTAGQTDYASGFPSFGDF